MVGSRIHGLVWPHFYFSPPLGAAARVDLKVPVPTDSQVKSFRHGFPYADVSRELF